MKRFHAKIFHASIVLCLFCGLADAYAMNDNADSLYRSIYPKAKLVDNDTLPGMGIETPRSKILGGGGNTIGDLLVESTKYPGKIDIESTVSGSGGKIYKIPIKVPAGMNGFEPELSLVYNSQNPDSKYGKGWSVSGLSEIRSVSKSIYYDGATSGIQGNTDDAFTLDGIRMIRQSLSESEAIYFTESGHIKVVGTISGGRFQSFTAYCPDGRQAYFHSDSYNGNNLFLISWLRDASGNEISYVYNGSLPTNIYYNGNIIEFKKSERDFPYDQYLGGESFGSNYIVDCISCKAGWEELWKYELAYSYKNNEPYLDRISFRSGDMKLTPLNFTYGTGNTSNDFNKRKVQLLRWYTTQEPETYGPAAKGVRYLTGSFDYENGNDGLVSWPDENPYWESQYGGGYIYENKYSGDELILISAGLAQDYEDPYSDIKTDAGFVDLFCADIAGDRSDRLVKVNNLVENGRDKLMFSIYGGHYYAGLSLQHRWSFDTGAAISDLYGQKYILPKFYYTGDFNGDGRMEVMSVSVENPSGRYNCPTKVCIYDLADGTTLYEGNAFSFSHEFVGERQYDMQSAHDNSDRLVVTDYDGDGKSDILLFRRNGVELYTFEYSSENLLSKKISSNLTYKYADLKGRDVVSGDFNGDGIVDFLLTPSSVSEGIKKLESCISKGDGNYDIRALESSYYASTYGYMPIDANNDGKTDIVKISDRSFYVRTAVGRTVEDLSDNAWFTDEKSILVPVNICGHGQRVRMIAVGKQGVITKYTFARDDTHESLATTMTDSYGITETNIYVAMNETDDTLSAYTKGESSRYPFIDMNESTPLLASTRTNMGEILVGGYDFQYDSAVTNMHGPGFCGFAEIYVTDYRGIMTLKSYDCYRMGVPVSESSPMFDTDYNFTITKDYLGFDKPQLVSKTETDILKGISVTSEYTYDRYGFVTNERKSASDGIVQTTSNRYVNMQQLTDGYVMGLQTRQEIQTERDGDISVQTKDVSHDEYLRPIQITESINGNHVSTKYMTYDAVGNKLSEGTKSYGSEDELIERYQYDNKGKTTLYTAPDGLTESYEYDKRENRNKKIDSRGNVTLYTYDDLDRQTSVTYPDGSSEKTDYQWVNPSDFWNGGFIDPINPDPFEPIDPIAPLGVKSNSANDDTDEFNPYVIKIITTKGDKSFEASKVIESVTYDRLGRERLFTKEGFDGKTYEKTIEYDQFGNKVKESEYLEPNTNFAGMTYEYDNYGRVVRQDRISGQNIQKQTFSYTGQQTIIHKVGNDIYRQEDSQGNIVSVSDGNGSVVHTLNAQGQPLMTDGPDKAVCTITYDAYGRRTAMTDSSHGTTAWTYDKAGNIESYTDGNDNVTSYEYDRYGRVKKETNAEFETVFSYNAYGDLISRKSSNGSSLEYEYDIYGRKSVETERSLDGKWLSRSYSYDDAGNLSETKYSWEGGELSEKRHSHGILAGIVINEETEIYRLEKEDWLGRPSKLLTGGLEREYECGRNVNHTLRKVSRDGILIQNISYEFDQYEENIISRNDGLVDEEFEYDAYNRLISYGNNEIEYDEIGNIISKSDIGSMTYGTTAKPFRQSSLIEEDTDVSSRSLSISYGLGGRPRQLKRSGLQYNFDYAYGGMRVRMITNIGDSITTAKYYIGNCMEIEEGTNSHTVRLYLGGSYYSAPAVYVADNDGARILYVLRDMLASVTHVVDTDGNVLQEISYDPWGRLCDPDTHIPYPLSSQPELILGRGFTGHEHLTAVGLINMNARLYDPGYGRFLSPDPYIEDAENIQCYNRYAYALNNPLKYRDESGEFIFTILRAVLDLFWNVGKHGVHFNNYSWKRTKNAFKIDMAMFKGNALQIIGKCSWWGALNSSIANITAHALNMFNQIDDVTYMDGMAALSGVTGNSGSAFTMGHLSFGPNGYKANWRDHLFVHEYGHYMQSQWLGPSYYFVVGLPSLCSAGFTSHWKGMNHNDRWFEMSASRAGASHFDKKYGSGKVGYDGGDKFFNKHYFLTGIDPTYKNPRLDEGNYWFPTSGSKINEWDFIF